MKRFALVALLLAPIVVLALLGWNLEPQPSECRAKEPHRKVGVKGIKLATLSVKKGESTTVPFGRGLETERLSVRLDVVKHSIIDPTNPLKILVGQFRREGVDDSGDIPRRRIFVNVRLVSSKLIVMRVCVDRSGPIESTDETDPPASDPAPPDPGSYQGDITITDRRVNEITVPLTIKLAYSHWPYVAILFYLVILAGSVYVWALRNKLEENDPVLSSDFLSGWKDWSFRWGGVVSIVAGSIGALTVFVATYLKSPDWGSGFDQVLGLFGAMFTAFVTAGSAPHIVSSVGGGNGRGGSGGGSKAPPTQPLDQTEREV